MTNKDTIRMHLESFLIETDQKGNLNVCGLIAYCVGYYGTIDMDTVEVILALMQEGWVRN